MLSTSEYILFLSGRKLITAGKKLKRHVIFIFLAIIFQALAGLSMKLAAQTLSTFSLFSVLTNLFFLASLTALLLQAVVWLQALKHYPLSIAYPCLSLVNFVILVIAAVYFNEGITVQNILGLTTISLGVFVLSRSEERT